MAPLKLFVFVRGLPRPRESTSFAIECSKTVGELKEATFPKIVQSPLLILNLSLARALSFSFSAGARVQRAPSFDFPLPL